MWVETCCFSKDQNLVVLMVITCIVIIESHNGMSTLKIPMILYMGVICNLATRLSWTLATVSHSVTCLLYKFNLPMLANLKSCIVLMQISSFISRTACCPFNLYPVSTSTDNILEFSCGNWLLPWKSPYSLTSSCTCSPTRPQVSTLWIVHLLR
jgi:hypothetical protein